MNLDDFKKIADTPEKKIATDNCIGIFLVGSSLYGTRTPESDFDYTGVFIEPEEYVLGRKNIESVEFKSNSSSSGKRNEAGDLDTTFYSLRKWFDLFSNNNPNQIELLFAPKQNIIYSTEYLKTIIDNRGLFTSLKCYHSMKGYAHAQRDRLQLKSGRNTGRTWLQEKFGFDTKLAMHNIRLYLECVQILKEGKIDFPLAENKMLIDIKQGKYSFEEFVKRSEELKNLCDLVYANSSLQHSPNHEEISKLQIMLYKKFLNL